jgi:prepilin-type N-terminal cleavage/methylation domain-containing protein
MRYLMKNQGFTLIEIAVSLSIFAILITLTMGAFLRGFYLQKKVIEMQAVQREAAYLMEIVSREIRTASDVDAGQAQNTDSSLTISNHEGDSLIFCRSSVEGVCTNNNTGEYFAMGQVGAMSVINASDIKVNRLIFYTSSFTNQQPLVTISMELQSRKDPTVVMSLQSSVAMRLYE